MKQRPKQQGGGLTARRSAGLAALAGAALLIGGCASPTTGRVRDAQLLYGDWQRPAAIAEARQAGPFFEHVATADGARRDSWRPFLHTRITTADGAASHDEWLWPVYSANRRDGALSWRFLLWFGQDSATADDDASQRLWLFPIWFQGRSQQGRTTPRCFPSTARSAT